MRFAGRAVELGLAVGLAAMGLSGCSPRRGTPSTTTAGEGAVVFIENDYVRALGEARGRGVPLFIDMWAPWCHTCLSLRAYVFPDASLRPLATRFVWLALDTEREENAPIVERLAVKVLPTLFVLDAATERVRLAHPGSLTATELVALLRPLATGAAIDAPTATSPEATAAEITRLADAKDSAACVIAGAAAAPRMPPGTPLADALRAALGCGKALPADAPERARLPELVAVGERVVSDATQPILADDRSDLYDYVIDAMRDLGRADDAKRLAAAWVAFLDDRAARAPTPAARTVFDAHRLLAYEAIGEPARALPMLEESQRQFPQDYNPPARLGRVLFDLGRYDEAVTDLERALGLAYGPRKLRLWMLEADVFVAERDPPGAHAALERALAFSKTLPLTGSYPALRDAIAARLAAMDAAQPTR